MTRPDGGPAVETREVVVHGLRLRVLMAGDGPPLVLLHGIAGSADEYLDVLPRFGRTFRVAAPDAPGHGFSDKPRSHRYDVESFVESTLGVMDALGIERAPVLAASGGGAVALSIALDRPERIAKLVLVDAAGLGSAVSWRYRLASLPFTRHAMRRMTRRQIETFGRALCFNRDRLPEGWIDRRLHIWSTPGAVDAFAEAARRNIGLRGQRQDFSGRLHEVRQPTLVIWGRQDPILPVAHAFTATHLIPDAQLHIFERCGHMPVWEYPDEFCQLVLQFLQA